VCGAAGALDGLCGRGWRFINLILFGYGLPAVLAASLALLWRITDRTVFLTTGPAIQDLVGGQLDYMIDQSLNVIPQIKAGTIKVYAIAAPERLASLPDVPTTVEGGSDFIFSAWNAMVAPKGTPTDIVAKLAGALSKALDDPLVQARYVELGSSVPKGADRGPAGLQKLVESEIARITPIIKAAGVTAN
jgi:putative tricarboxylic transport membrane protein